MKKIYLDYAASCPVDKRVLKKMMPYFSKKYGNSSSLHYFGQEARVALEEARKKVADLIWADPEEIIFTSSATESNNMALKGIVSANKGKHIVISQIEHPCVAETSDWLEKQGVEVTRLSVDKYGLINLSELEKAIKENTILVSIIHASNEVGTIQSLEKISKICQRKGVYFHTDAVQSFGKIPINVKKLKIDLLTASSHKIYGPKGAACLFIRKGIRIDPLLHGGGQENRLRPSTVNVASIVGFAEACQIAQKEISDGQEIKRLINLRNKLIKNISKIDGVYLNGHPEKRLPNNINFWFSFIEGESIIIQLDLLGICTSTGSACSSDKLEPSHVLLALGLKPQEAHGSLRISLGRFTTEQEVDYLIKKLPEVIKKLRKISPFKK